MSEQSFDSQKLTVEEILTKALTYEVPTHQRDYSWDKEETDAFWNDLIASDKEDNYFFGSIILQKSSDKKKKIILDGQQRLVTVTILLSAIRDIFYDLGDAKMAQSIHQNYIIGEHLGKMVKKVILNLRNRDFFFYCIQQYPDDSKRQNFQDFERKNTAYKTNKLLKNAYVSFRSNIEECLIGKTKDGKKELLLSIAKNLTEKFIVIEINVSSEEEAYMIFETINDRGLELSVADLFKNYLIRKADKKEKDDVVRVWQDIVALLDDKIRPFLRHYWASKFQPVTERRLFSMLKDHIEKKRNNVRSFVQELKAEATVYSYLLRPDLDYWKDKEIVLLLEDFNVLNVTQCLILFMSGKDKFKNKAFKKLLKIGINFVFRYSTICNLHNNILEKKYSEISTKIRGKKVTNVDQVKELLSDIYPADGQFYEKFRLKDIKVNPIARYILGKIDDYLSNKPEKTDYSILTLEHILPKSPDKKWKSYLKKKNIDKKAIKELVDKIGNLTLLEEKMNNEAANKFYDHKRDNHYKKSSLEINSSLKTIKDWEKQTILDRQEKFANLAKDIWKI
jgi:uncharacterized protein with ParB-like and HNH nuclease domain